MVKLNNKGYMLVEIILASVIAFGVAYFITNLTIKLKNKNDDMLVETQVMTDRAIITNKLMKYIIDDGSSFNCNNITIAGKTIKYKTYAIDTVSDFVDFNQLAIQKNCNTSSINITIPLRVPQVPDRNFDVIIDYKL